MAPLKSFHCEERPATAGLYAFWAGSASAAGRSLGAPANAGKRVAKPRTAALGRALQTQRTFTAAKCRAGPQKS